MIALREITYWSILLRIGAAFLLGGILGWERETKNRAAGLRTYMLVCVGACMIMLTNQYIYQFFGVGDPVRMGAQVVSGIGFLGAGTIVVTHRNKITGLTTAAGLWASAAVGLAVGIGFYEAAFVGALLIIVILTIMYGLDNRIRRKTRQMELYVELDSHVSISRLAKRIRELGAEVAGVQIDRDYSMDGRLRAVILSLRTIKKIERQGLLDALQETEGIICVEEI